MRSKWQNRKCDRSLKTFKWNPGNVILCYNLTFLSQCKLHRSDIL